MLGYLVAQLQNHLMVRCLSGATSTLLFSAAQLSEQEAKSTQSIMESVLTFCNLFFFIVIYLSLLMQLSPENKSA